MAVPAGARIMVGGVEARVRLVELLLRELGQTVVASVPLPVDRTRSVTQMVWRVVCSIGRFSP